MPVDPDPVNPSDGGPQAAQPKSPDHPPLVGAAADRRNEVLVAGHAGDAATARSHLDDPEPEVRATALRALARCQQLTADQLQSASADPAVPVRRRAAELSATHDGDVPLEQLLSDPADSVAEISAWACGERTDGVRWLPQLMPMATEHDNPLCREAAVAALGAIGDPRGMDAILAACSDRPAVRRRAVLALSPFAPDGNTTTSADQHPVLVAWEAALDDRDWQVRQAAEDLLGRAR